MTTRTIPLPQPTELSQPFWDGCREGRLLVQKCEDCSRLVFTPQAFCRYCLGRKLQWVPSSGRGVVYSYTTLWRPATPEFTVPYTAAIVDLDDGYQMMSNIVGCEPDEVRVGMDVEVVFEQITPEVTLPKFKPRMQ